MLHYRVPAVLYFWNEKLKQKTRFMCQNSKTRTLISGFEFWQKIGNIERNRWRDLRNRLWYKRACFYHFKQTTLWFCRAYPPQVSRILGHSWTFLGHSIFDHFCWVALCYAGRVVSIVDVLVRPAFQILKEGLNLHQFYNYKNPDIPGQTWTIPDTNEQQMPQH